MRSVLVIMTLAACAPEPARSEPPTAVAAAQHEPTPPPPPVVATPPANEAPAPAANPVPTASANDPRWHASLRAIAAGYTSWGRVDDQMRWAPTLCAMPQPARARISASGDENTHGRKLYTLYAKDPVAYGAQKSFTPAPEVAGLTDIKQVVVKEAFVPVETAKPDHSMGLGGGLMPAEHKGKTYVPGDALGIYVVFQPNLRPNTASADTDDGWVYGTVAADLKTVTSSGKVASCMGCHQKVPKGRLFGLAEKQEWPPGPGPDGRHRSSNSANNK